MHRRLSVIALLAVAAVELLAAQTTQLPVRPEALKFAVIGDTGTGAPPQFDVGSRLNEARSAFPFDMVIMLGDNIYGRQTAQDFVDKFRRPYAALLTGGVTFYATLGNHDSPMNRYYPGFNMGGQRYYTYTKKNTQFFVLDSNAMDVQQVAWLENALKQSREEWKICYFHHPLYSDGGRHGSEVELRVILEPIFVKYGVNVVYSGHDHIYERVKPQKGITYFVNGSSGELRRGDTHPSDMTAAFFDQDEAFSLVEIDGDTLYFQARSRTGQTVDAGVIHRAAGNPPR